MAEERQKVSAEVSDSQGLVSERLPGNPRTAHVPDNVIELINLAEIEAMWGIGVDRVYRAAERGMLRRYGRPGQRRYYSRAELTSLFGEPKFGPQTPQNRARPNGSDARGGHQQSFELDTAAAAA